MHCRRVCKPVAANLLLVALIMAVLSMPALAANKKLMTVNAAKVVAQRAIVESVIGLKVRSREQVRDMIAESVEIDAKTAAAIKGIEFVDIVYDRNKDIAKVTAEIKVGRVSNIIGRNIDYGNRTVKRVGFATSTPAMAPPLQALRAAELDAYKNLAQQIVGFKLQSGTSVENFILRSDDIRTKLMAAIYGAELEEYGWDEDGNAHVKLVLKLRDVEDVLGQRLDYQGELIRVEGVGAQEDDFAAASRGSEDSFSGRSSGIREGSLDVPVTSSGDFKGEGLSTSAPSDGAGGAADLMQRYE